MLYLTLLQIDANYLNNVTYLPSQHDPDHPPVVVAVFVYWVYLLYRDKASFFTACSMYEVKKPDLSFKSNTTDVRNALFLNCYDAD